MTEPAKKQAPREGGGGENTKGVGKNEKGNTRTREKGRPKPLKERKKRNQTKETCQKFVCRGRGNKKRARQGKGGKETLGLGKKSRRGIRVCHHGPARKNKTSQKKKKDCWGRKGRTGGGMAKKEKGRETGLQRKCPYRSRTKHWARVKGAKNPPPHPPPPPHTTHHPPPPPPPTNHTPPPPPPPTTTPTPPPPPKPNTQGGPETQGSFGKKRGEGQSRNTSGSNRNKNLLHSTD